MGALRERRQHITCAWQADQSLGLVENARLLECRHIGVARMAVTQVSVWVMDLVVGHEQMSPRG